MLLRLSKPSPAALQRLLERANDAAPTYPEVGATISDVLPTGYRHDLYEVKLGVSEAAFGRAVDGLRRWQAHVGAGVNVVPRDAPVAAKNTVLLTLKVGGLWTVAPCRIVYVIDEEAQFGFAYGTLPGHPEIGEAAFTVSRDDSGEALFRIRSFSRPADPLARAAAPFSRRVQRTVTQRYLDALTRAAAG
jgi:uncharacterized protein (UPF0548 family)